MNYYPRKEFGCLTKRYCQTLELRNDKQLIEKYIEAHNRYNHWPEIREGIRQVGILEMEIYIHDNKLFMIVETPSSSSIARLYLTRKLTTYFCNCLSCRDWGVPCPRSGIRKGFFAQK